jgi:hypothetical protein
MRLVFDEVHGSYLLQRGRKLGYEAKLESLLQSNKTWERTSLRLYKAIYDSIIAKFVQDLCLHIAW